MPQLVVGIMHMEIGDQGWSEKYYLSADSADPATKEDILKNLVWGRSAFFGTGVTCTYARVSKVGPAPDKRIIQLPYPIGPHPSWTGGAGPGDTIGPVNDYTTCVQQVTQGAAGKWANRYYRCFPDTWVQNKILQAGLLQYFQAAPVGSPTDMSPGGGLGHLAVCQAFWRVLISSTWMARRVTPTDYTPTVITDVVFRQVTSKKIGRPFGTSRGRRPSTLIS